VLHHHLEARHPAAHRIEHALDEHCLAVKNVDVAVGHFAMHAQRQADVGHAFQHTLHLGEVANAGL
jgi:hypothetical protein